MCRIVGIYDQTYKKEYNIRQTLEKMRDSMTYGGPDDKGIFIKEQGGVGLAHRRLAILDLSNAGHQPMFFENLTIVYNGEIYNFKEIRKELESYGYTFLSNTDTEVILKAFHKWGIDSIKKFRGMWAFAIWDDTKEELILCRDRIGVKPLYFFYKNKRLIFSSEIKAILEYPYIDKHINYNASALFLQYGYIPTNETIFKDIYKLEPGSLLIFNKQGNIRIDKYWSIEEIVNNKQNDLLLQNENEIIEYVEQSLEEAFKYRLVSDVPIGIYFSGGIDSTLLTTLLQKNTSTKLKTFTVGFSNKKYDESQYARDLAKYIGTEHHEITIEKEKYKLFLFEVIELMDDPISDDAFIPTYYLSRFAKKHVKVVLSADGGDEIFGGYKKYIYAKNLYKFKTFMKFLRPIINSFIKKPYLNGFSYTKLLNAILSLDNDKNICNLNLNISKVISDKYLKNFIINIKENNICSYNYMNYSLSNLFLSEITIYDFKAYLPNNLLVKTDRATMYNSIEGREPLLDHKIVEIGMNLPDKIKQKNKNGKYILKKILKKYIPKQLFDRKKHGFDAPVWSFFYKEINELINNPDDLYDFFKIMLKPDISKEEFVEKKGYISKAGPLFKWNLYVLYLWSSVWVRK